MKKKVVIMMLYIIMLTIICLSLEYIPYNLRSNSVYYAKNMPRGEGQYPEIIMLVDNLEWVYKPEIEGLRYDTDGNRYIANTEEPFISFGDVYYDEIQYIFFDNNLGYSFNKNFKLLDISDTVIWESVDINTVNKNNIVKKIKDFLSPIIEAQPKPKVNLQWLFNLIYEDDFK